MKKLTLLSLVLSFFTITIQSQNPDVLPINLELPNSKKLEIQPLTEQIKEISKYVVLIKVKN